MELSEYAQAFKTCVVERSADGILEVRLHYRGGPMTWTALAHGEVPALLEAIASDRANRAMVLTGTDEAFILTPEGYGDVYRSGRVKPSDWERGLGEATRMLHGLLDLPIPVVAAVNGPVTGHAELLFLCDSVIATPDAYFQDAAHIPGGLVPGDGVQVLWPLVLGPVRARHFLLTGEKISAADAHRLGVVAEVVDRAGLLPRARELASQLADVDPLVMRHARQLLARPIRRALELDLTAGLGIEAYVSVSRFPEFDTEGPA